MQTKLWHKLFHFHLPFRIWKVWKGRENLQKFEYLENEKSFLDEIKSIFHSFWRPIIWSKNKKLIKNSRHKLNVVERTTAKNYHPISLLSVVNKAFEKLVNDRTVDHLEKCGLFSGFQYGFKSSRSTADPLIVVYDRIGF